MSDVEELDFGGSSLALGEDAGDYVIRGRCLLPDGSECGFDAHDVSMTRFEMAASVDLPIGGVVICFLDGIGIIPGQVIGRTAQGRFHVRPHVTPERRAAIGSRIEWHAGQKATRHEHRSAERIVPRTVEVAVRLGEKMMFKGRLINVSMTGAAIALNPLFCPFVGSVVKVGRREATVVRLLKNGIAVHFRTAIRRDAFDENIVL